MSIVQKYDRFKIIAETAFSHEGDSNYLLKQIDEAVKGNVDIIKFQVFVNESEYFVFNHPSIANVKDLMIEKKDWVMVFEEAKKKGLRIIALPLNISSLEFCEEQSKLIDYYEIHSVCFNEKFFISRFQNIKKKLIIGVGGRTKEEIDYLLESIKKPTNELIFMAGFQSFPTDSAKLNLLKIKELKTHYNCILGYADHSGYDDTSYLELNNLAYVMGVRFFEKHIVIEKGSKRIDFEAAIDHEEFKKMRISLVNCTNILGDGNLDLLNDKELVYSKREKQIVAKRSIQKGNNIHESDLWYKIANEEGDFRQMDIENIIGKKALVSIHKDQVLFKKYIS